MLRENFRKAKAALRGEAVSQARRILPASEIKQVAEAMAEGRDASRAPQPIPTAGVRMKDGNPMVFYTDGSLRHAAGHKPGKAARKARKRELQRRRQK